MLFSVEFDEVVSGEALVDSGDDFIWFSDKVVGDGSEGCFGPTTPTHTSKRERGRRS